MREKMEKVANEKNSLISTIKNNRGITLVALVITIIVLIILAGVSINLVLGQNGIITKVQEAKIQTALSAVKEQIRLYQAEEIIEEKEVTPETLLANGKVTRTVQLG